MTKKQVIAMVMNGQCDGIQKNGEVIAETAMEITMTDLNGEGYEPYTCTDWRLRQDSIGKLCYFWNNGYEDNKRIRPFNGMNRSQRENKKPYRDEQFNYWDNAELVTPHDVMDLVLGMDEFIKKAKQDAIDSWHNKILDEEKYSEHSEQ
jgi:hypothetical protein